jgi:hypothetical protein
VGPLLEQQPVLLQHPREHRRAVAVHPRGEDQVVGALDCADGVHLHEPHPLDQLRHASWRRRGLSGRVVEQALPVQ